MNCPQCGKPMETHFHDRVRSRNTQKVYNKDAYVCKEDDVWLTVETPRPDPEKKKLQS